jgi:hypothetical protein
MLTLPGVILRVQEFGKNFGFDTGCSFVAVRLNRFEVAKLVEPTCER